MPTPRLTFSRRGVLELCRLKAVAVCTWAEPLDLKTIALTRIYDLGRLFCEVHSSDTIRMISAPGQVASIFGFNRILVKNVVKFTSEFSKMVNIDINCCWHANGRQTLQQPTSPCYEILRQLGVHPFKGTRRKALQGAGEGSTSRDLMFHPQFALT